MFSRHHPPRRSNLICHALLGLAAVFLLVAVACSQKVVNNNSSASSGDVAINTSLPANSNLNTIDPSNLNGPPDSGNAAPANAVVSITSSGFAAPKVTVRLGGTVTWKNDDTQPHWPASDPHPDHTALPGLDALIGLAPGKSYSYTFTKSGTFTYHDHLQSSTRGTVVVE